MSAPEQISVYVVTEAHIEAEHPTLVGSGRWESPDGISFDYKGEEWANQRIQEALATIARVEAIRRAQATVDHCLVVERADELCRMMYEVPLVEYEKSAGRTQLRGLFRVAQREIERERP